MRAIQKSWRRSSSEAAPAYLLPPRLGAWRYPSDRLSVSGGYVSKTWVRQAPERLWAVAEFERALLRPVELLGLPGRRKERLVPLTRELLIRS